MAGRAGRPEPLRDPNFMQYLQFVANQGSDQGLIPLSDDAQRPSKKGRFLRNTDMGHVAKDLALKLFRRGVYNPFKSLSSPHVSQEWDAAQHGEQMPPVGRERNQLTSGVKAALRDLKSDITTVSPSSSMSSSHSCLHFSQFPLYV